VITFFTTTKPFRGQTRISQLNALNSWKKVHPDCEIIVFGDEFGTAGITRELDLIHIPDVEKSEYGTPYISSMFELAKVHGKYLCQAYMNADIILLDDFNKIIRRIPFKKFLLVGQRWDLDINEAVDFDSPAWLSRLRIMAGKCGKLHSPSGTDYFVYPRELWPKLPPLTVGRAGYDNWLIYWCRRHAIPVVDATTVVTAIHQNHDYSHIAGGHHTVWFGSDARRNLELAGGPDYMFNIADANWILSARRLRRNFCRGDRLRLINVITTLHPKTKLLKHWVSFFITLKEKLFNKSRAR